MPFADSFFILGTVVLYIAVFLTLYSGAEYVIRFSRSIKE
jgi:phosphatidylglycerophosphate synthase